MHCGWVSRRRAGRSAGQSGVGGRTCIGETIEGPVDEEILGLMSHLGARLPVRSSRPVAHRRKSNLANGRGRQGARDALILHLEDAEDAGIALSLPLEAEEGAH
jgi:hypothetical protein